MNKKVYFAGSIRGGRVDAELYRRMIRHMQKTDVVLTEHVGSPELNLLERGRDRDADIYQQDTACAPLTTTAGAVRSIRSREKNSGAFRAAAGLFFGLFVDFPRGFG